MRTSHECKLLLSFFQSHKPVVSSTIFGWSKKVLTISWVDIDVFKEHSAHAASASKTALSGLSVLDILERVILQHGKNFIISILSWFLRDFMSHFLINGFEPRVGSGLEYYLRAQFVEYSNRSYRCSLEGCFLKWLI